MLTLAETKRLLRRRAKKRYKKRLLDNSERSSLSQLAFFNGYRLRYRTINGTRGYALFDGQGTLVYGRGYLLTPESVAAYFAERGEAPSEG
jgi:hypothetical protein